MSDVLSVLQADLPSRDMPVPAILAGLGFRGAVAGLLGTSPDVDMFVDVDMALPGLELLKCPPGVAFPDREPKDYRFH